MSRIFSLLGLITLISLSSVLNRIHARIATPTHPAPHAAFRAEAATR